MTRPALPAQPWRVSMRPRDPREPHRASTPLELLFDLTFVVAVSLAASALAHDVTTGHVADGVLGYATVFFAIWWAWMNFTWFASGYDTDDTPYRLLTMVQMAGVLVLAAGIPAAFADEDFRAVTIGYLVMRLAMVSQWLRAARTGGAQGRTARRYALGITLVQVGWVLRLAVPEQAQLGVFGLLVLAELAVPPWAERATDPAWHPHHVAERYGLFTLILLGESVLAATAAVQTGLTQTGLTAGLLTTSLAALLLLFGSWWLYFLHPAGDALAAHPARSFAWGYGHYLLFAALAATGAGLEVVVEGVSGHAGVPSTVVTLAVAAPVAVFLLLLAPLDVRRWDGGAAALLPARTLLAAGATLALGISPSLGVPIPAAVLGVALPTVVLVVVAVVGQDRRAATATRPTPAAP